jgi:dihydroorotase-like cyclic amidohydrolase
VVVLDADRPWHVTPTSVYAHCGWSAYEGRTLFGAAALTLRRGRVVYESKGERFGEPDGAWLQSRTTREP